MGRPIIADTTRRLFGHNLLFALVIVMAAPAWGVVQQWDDCQMTATNYLITHASGNNFCCASLGAESGTGCGCGNSLVVTAQRSGGTFLNYNVHVTIGPFVYTPTGDDAATSTFTWSLNSRAGTVYDIASHRVIARQGSAVFELANTFEPPGFAACYNWSGTVPLSNFYLIMGIGTNGNRLDLSASAAPIQFGVRLYQFANPWPTVYARPRMSNLHIALVTNHAPVVQAILEQKVAETCTLTVSPVGTDIDSEPLAWGGENLPAGAAVDPTTGKLTWIVAIGQAGDYPDIALVASDPRGATGRAAFTIRVLDYVCAVDPDHAWPSDGSGLALKTVGANPFVRSTAFAVFRSTAEPVAIKVYDLRGRLIADLGAVVPAPEGRVITWNGRRMDGAPAASGLYLVRASAGAHTRSLAIVKVER